MRIESKHQSQQGQHVVSPSLTKFKDVHTSFGKVMISFCFNYHKVKSPGMLLEGVIILQDSDILLRVQMFPLDFQICDDPKKDIRGRRFH